jgi:hypothetical protein
MLLMRRITVLPRRTGDFPLHDLIIIEPSIGALTTSEIDATMAYAAAEKSHATHRAYAFDWKNFEVWCLARRACSLAAHQGLVAAYLSHLAQSGRKASTIGRRAAASGHKHKLAGFTEPPTNTELVRATMRGIRRSLGNARSRRPRPRRTSRRMKVRM